MVTNRAGETFTPLLSVPPLSCACTLTIAVPSVLPGVKVSVPKASTAGCTRNRLLLLLVTMKSTVCELSIGGPAEMFVTSLGAVTVNPYLSTV